jgi:NADPH:quinone reductase-like Zn-dependent oxidoreductase
MRAVVYERYGPPDVLRLEEVERPAPAEDEVLVRIHATTVNRTDCGLRSAEYVITRYFTGLLRPKRGMAGSEFAGEVEGVGAAVTEFRPGDRVFGLRQGANAEFLCVREGGAVAHMPAGMTFDEAAAVGDGALTALTFLRRAEVRPGERIVVYGASGSIGTAAVQLARHFGAHVTAVCNTKNVGLVRSLGPDEVVDYLAEDFTRSGETYDVVFDAVGKLSFRRCRRSLRPGGRYATTGNLRENLFWFLWTRRIGDKKAILAGARFTKEDLLFLKSLIEADEYRAVVDRRYPLEDVVEATRYVETGEKTGNVVLTVDGGPPR